MKYSVILVILALAFAPCLAAQGRYKPSPEMMQGHFDAPAQEVAPIVAPVVVTVNVPACHGVKCHFRRINRIVRAAMPFLGASVEVAENVYWWQHAADPFPAPKKPK